MFNKFNPDIYIESFETLDLDRLKEKGIKFLLCDIDNTMIPHDEPHPSPEAIAFFKKLKDEGFGAALISNNHKNRVETFARELDLQYFYSSKKPFKGVYKKVMARFAYYNKSEMAVMGDQLLTDILGGNRSGFLTILCDPLVTKDLSWTKINRKFEAMVYNRLEKEKKLVKGEYRYERV